MDLQFQRTGAALLRESIARGELSEVEFGMLKKHGDKLRWGTKEKTIMLDLATETFIAKNPVMQAEVVIRSLCHSRVVTADYVERGERFSLKSSVLVLGQLGEVMSAWAELVQPALYLFAKDCNIIWVEVPAFSTNSLKWMRYGPSILIAALKELRVDTVKVLASGVGGSVFLETLRQSPKFFGKTHLVYNFDLPRGSKGLPFSIHELEDLLRERELQLWFAYNDEENVFDRSDWGTPMRAFEAVTKLQARLEGERRRGFRQLDYDEILVTEALNGRWGDNIRRIPVGRDVLLSMSEAFLQSMALYFELAPQTFQEDLENGLPPQSHIKKKFRPTLNFPKGPDGELPELPALRRMRLGPLPGERPAIADSNRRRAERVTAATLCLLPPSKRNAALQLQQQPASSERPVLQSSASAPALKAEGEEMTAQPALPGALLIPPDLDDEDDSLVLDHSKNRGETLASTYRAMWMALRK